MTTRDWEQAAEALRGLIDGTLRPGLRADVSSRFNALVTAVRAALADARAEGVRENTAAVVAGLEGVLTLWHRYADENRANDEGTRWLVRAGGLRAIIIANGGAPQGEDAAHDEESGTDGGEG